MSRKDRDDSIWLSEHSDKKRIRDAENARQNRAEITKALSHGQIRRRDLVKWGLFTSAGIMLPIGGLNPFVRPLRGFAGHFPHPGFVFYLNVLTTKYCHLDLFGTCFAPI